VWCLIEYHQRQSVDCSDLAYQESADRNFRAGEHTSNPTLNLNSPARKKSIGVFNTTPDLIYWIAWSRDGKQLLTSHGRFMSDIVLLNRNKAGS
jgi:hypothetical protein